jgi:hypothetical protein
MDSLTWGEKDRFLSALETLAAGIAAKQKPTILILNMPDFKPETAQQLAKFLQENLK